MDLEYEEAISRTGKSAVALLNELGDKFQERTEFRYQILNTMQKSFQCTAAIQLPFRSPNGIGKYKAIQGEGSDKIKKKASQKAATALLKQIFSISDLALIPQNGIPIILKYIEPEEEEEEAEELPCPPPTLEKVPDIPLTEDENPNAIYQELIRRCMVLKWRFPKYTELETKKDEVGFTFQCSIPKTDLAIVAQAPSKKEAKQAGTKWLLDQTRKFQAEKARRQQLLLPPKATIPQNMNLNSQEPPEQKKAHDLPSPLTPKPPQAHSWTHPPSQAPPAPPQTPPQLPAAKAHSWAPPPPKASSPPPPPPPPPPSIYQKPPQPSNGGTFPLIGATKSIFEPAGTCLTPDFILNLIQTPPPTFTTPQDGPALDPISRAVLNHISPSQELPSAYNEWKKSIRMTKKGQDEIKYSPVTRTDRCTSASASTKSSKKSTTPPNDSNPQVKSEIQEKSDPDEEEMYSEEEEEPPAEEEDTPHEDFFGIPDFQMSGPLEDDSEPVQIRRRRLSDPGDEPQGKKGKGILFVSEGSSKEVEKKPEKKSDDDLDQMLQLDKYGIGYRLALKMNFTPGKGLGKNEQGIVIPIKEADPKGVRRLNREKLPKMCL